MIVLRNLTKTFSIQGHRKTVADNLNMTFPTGVAVGLLGRNGAGKSTLLKLIAGTSTPTWGEVLSTGSVSFPVGLASSLHADLTGAQNTRFVARIYGADTESLLDWVEEFAELGAHFHLPVRTYSSGMKGRLSFGINMGLAFDTYLVDEITAVGDAAFRRKSSEVFHARMQKSGAIYVSHSMGQVRELCTAGALLENGKLAYYEDVEEAIERYLVSLDPSRAHASAALPGEGQARSRFPASARMLYAMGLPATLGEWAVNCLRRHKPVHFGGQREIHYFDARGGQGKGIRRHRTRILNDLAARLETEQPSDRQKTLRLMGEMSNILRIHNAPPEGPDRHDAYVDYMLTGHSGQPVVCDYTPDYAHLDREDFAEMQSIGETAFCVVLRDPVDRLWETLCTDLPQEDRTPEAAAMAVVRLARQGPEAALAQQPAADYARIYERLSDTVPASQQIFLLHERLASPVSRSAELARLTAALEIPEVPVDRVPDLPKAPDIPPLDDISARVLRVLLAPQYAATLRRFGSLPSGWRDPGAPGATARAAE